MTDTAYQAGGQHADAYLQSQSKAPPLVPPDRAGEPFRVADTKGNAKPSNPKDAVGIKKAGLSVLPTRVCYEVATGMLEGALKYGRHNYRVIGVRASVYYDATMRHLDAWWEGEDVDPDSQLSHVTKAICSLMVLRDAMIRGNCTDDRPPRSADGWLVELNARAAALIEARPDPVPAFTEKPVASLVR